MRLALQLARRGYGHTSPNPTVGALLVKAGKIIGRGWHHRAGAPHAEINALLDAQRRGLDPKGAALYVTLEPCCTHGRTPPCTDALISAGIHKVVAATADPNPLHAGRGLRLLARSRIRVAEGLLDSDATRLNEAFNHWIVTQTPFVTVKAAMTLDGKIATFRGESKWITGAKSRAWAMHLRQGADAILIGVNTIIHDNPSLTARTSGHENRSKNLRRILFDPHARNPVRAPVISDALRCQTPVVVGPRAPKKRVLALEQRATVLRARQK